MALKFLNKKGWHTGSLRNIENVWKAEQKHEAEQKKLEELRKQIHEERERNEFRQLQEQAGLVPRQERLEFLYDSGLAVGKGSSTGFESLSKPADPGTTAPSSSSAKPQASVPGALFEDKPQSSNDAWRKLHSDPLLMIRQREQEALARVKNNPVQMAMIRKSVETMKHKGKTHDEKDKDERKHKHPDKKSKRHHSKSKHSRNSSPGKTSDLDGDSSEDNARRKKESRTEKRFKEGRSSSARYSEGDNDTGRDKARTRYSNPEVEKNEHRDDNVKVEKYERQIRSDFAPRHELRHNYRKPLRLSEEERAARLREMQKDAEVHEEQRWKRIKKAEENDAKEAVTTGSSGGRNFLDAAQRSVYGAGKGGSSTIEESVRRRTHYSQRAEASESNAFRR